jgi:hypothetical protein
MKKLELKYNDWQIHPEILQLNKSITTQNAIWQGMATKHEGKVLYYKLWNFWVRAGTDADQPSDYFFKDYESTNAQTDALLGNIGFAWRKAETEKEVWDRMGLVWNWLRENVTVNNEAYSSISTTEGWPSLLDYAKYYADNGNLVWAACFSKAHLFASLLGRVIYPRYRFAIASAHHAENGAPPTATHVYVAVYVAERWFYLDPTAVQGEGFPNFSQRKSIGVSSFATVDYEHPYKMLPIPLSGFTKIPYLPK